MVEVGTFLDLTVDFIFWARKYAAKGLYMVPLHSLVDGKCTCSKGAECGRNAGKHPVWGNWPKRATPSFDEAKTWFKDNSPRNLGIAAGHGIVVLDVDGEIGRESLEQLMGELGDDWPVGPVAETGSGGMHFLFRTQENFSNRVGEIMPGLDIRSLGGQIVACPSIHRSGRRYAWLHNSFDLEIPPLPDQLADRMRGAVASDFDPRPWLEKQEAAISGDNGSKQLMRVTGTLIKQGRVRNLEKYLRVITPWNARCSPPWTERELSHAFENAFGRFQGEATVDLPMDKNGIVICDRVALDKIISKDAKYEWAFQSNEITKETLYNGQPLKDVDVTEIETEICARYRVREIKRSWIENSIELAAYRHRFNPVRDYLERLRWDGIERLSYLPTFLGAPQEEIYQTYLRKWAIGAVKRVFQPGCKLDTVLILQGATGVGKSTFFRTLFSQEYFRDTEMNLDNKDSYQQIQTWGYEWSELENVMDRRTISQVKAFLSSQTDVFRLPYARAASKHPRIVTIVGSSNKRELLNDPTGSRRFWIVPVGTAPFDIPWLEKARDQLWAEAVHRMRAGEAWWLSREDDEVRERVSAAFVQVDELYEAARALLERMETEPTWQGHVIWETLCARLAVQNPSNFQRVSIVRALQEAFFAPRRLKMLDGFRKFVWSKTPYR